MMTMNEMEQALRSLRLSGMRASLEARAMQANDGSLPFLDTFSLLLQDELDRRRTRLLERRHQLSGLPEIKSLSDFDWSFNPKVPKKSCFELLTLKFIGDHEDALILGAPGTGKSHVAKAIGHAAVRGGYRLLYREAHQLFEDLNEATISRSRKKLMQTLAEADLLIIDDLALRKLPPSAGEDILEIVMNRYQKRSTVITSNRVLDDWGKVFGDSTLSSAILDRLMHNGHFLKFEGKSYRLHQASKRLAEKETAKK